MAINHFSGPEAAQYIISAPSEKAGGTDWKEIMKEECAGRGVCNMASAEPGWGHGREDWIQVIKCEPKINRFHQAFCLVLSLLLFSELPIYSNHIQLAASCWLSQGSRHRIITQISVNEWKCYSPRSYYRCKTFRLYYWSIQKHARQYLPVWGSLDSPARRQCGPPSHFATYSVSYFFLMAQLKVALS